MNKDPKKRPTLASLKNDAFFKGNDSIDWDKLARREIQPPQLLTKYPSQLQDQEEFAFNESGGARKSPQTLSPVKPLPSPRSGANTQALPPRTPNGGVFKLKDELELLFEADEDDVESGSSQKPQRALFEDEDYEEHNKRHNRVKSYECWSLRLINEVEVN